MRCCVRNPVSPLSVVRGVKCIPRIYSLTGTIHELADPYNATINVYVKLCHQLWEEKGRAVVLHLPVCSVVSSVLVRMGRIERSVLRDASMGVWVYVCYP